MGGNYFDQMAQELQKQIQYMEVLIAENRELRQQVADLHSGRGVFLEINGNRFPLYSDALETKAVSPITETLPAISAIKKMALCTQATSSQQAQPENTIKLPEKIDKEQTAQARPTQDTHKETVKNTTDGASTFLEEIMVDEFAHALAQLGPAWQESQKKARTTRKLNPTDGLINEEQKAVLRKELIGSFLLE